MMIGLVQNYVKSGLKQYNQKHSLLDIIYIKMIKSRTILVTGSNKGLGYALVNRLCSYHNIQIIMTFRKGNDGFQKYLFLKQKYPQLRIEYYYLDLMIKQSIQQCIQKIRQNHIKIDVVVNNAALGYDEPNQIPDYEIAKSYLYCNFVNTVEFTNKIKTLLSTDGKIINVSSRVGALQFHSLQKQNLLRNENITLEDLYKYVEEFLKGCKDRNLQGWGKSSYSTSKSFLNCWNRFILRKELAEQQSCLCLSPGFCMTDMVVNSKLQGKPVPKTPQEGIKVIEYCIFEIPFSNLNSGKIYFNNQQWNYQQVK